MMPAFALKNRRFILACACIALWPICFQPVAMGAEPKPDLKVARLTILEQTRRNQAGIACCALHWTRTTTENEYIPDRKGTTAGTYSLYWDGSNTATQLKHSFYARKPDASFEVAEFSGRSAWNGHEFRTIRDAAKPGAIMIFDRPQYATFENYYEISGWHRNKTETSSQLSSILSDPAKQVWNIYKTRRALNGPEFVQIVAASRSDGGGRIEWTFDPGKAYSLVSEKHYDGEERLYVEALWAHEQVAGGVWFPTRIVQEFRDVETNAVTLRHEFAVDTKRSKFNERSAMPPEAFTINTEPETGQSEHQAAGLDSTADVLIHLYSRTKEMIVPEAPPPATSSPSAIVADNQSHNWAARPLVTTH